MTKSRFIFLFLVSSSLITNTIKPEEDLLTKAGTTVFLSVIGGISWLAGQTAYQIVVDKWFPSDKTTSDIDSAKQQTATYKEQQKDAELTTLEHKQNMLQKAGYSKEEREEVELRIKETMRAKIDEDVNPLSDSEKAKLASKRNTAKKNKVNFFAKLSSAIALAGTKAGDTADLIASYSFAHITNLDCFKDTFVSANAQQINRSLVALTTFVICYKGYKAYQNKFSGEYDADDFFNNDED